MKCDDLLGDVKNKIWISKMHLKSPKSFIESRSNCFLSYTSFSKVFINHRKEMISFLKGNLASL